MVLTLPRILLVDDFAPWRQSVRRILKGQAKVRVVDEVEDGLEAVQKARQLEPDLILLDIGLPSLNGIEVARRIHQNVPRTRILFLTISSNRDVAQMALNTGAHGYVLKTDAGSELGRAIQETLHGNRFVSSGLRGRVEINCN